MSRMRERDGLRSRVGGRSPVVRCRRSRSTMPGMSDAAATRAKRTLRVGDLDLRVLDGGDGLPVLLLHGFPNRAEVWRHVGARLRGAGRRTIAPDLIGHD